MPNKWTEHVKAYAEKHKMKYGDALKDPKCKECYKSETADKKDAKKAVKTKKTVQVEGMGSQISRGRVEPTELARNPFVVSPARWLLASRAQQRRAFARMTNEDLETMEARVEAYLERLAREGRTETRDAYDYIADDYVGLANSILYDREGGETKVEGGKLKSSKEINREIRKGFKKAIEKPKKLINFVGSFKKKSDNPYETTMSRFTSPLLSKMLSQYNDEYEDIEFVEKPENWKTMSKAEKDAFQEQVKRQRLIEEHERFARQWAEKIKDDEEAERIRKDVEIIRKRREELKGSGPVLSRMRRRVAPERIPDTILEEPVAPIQRQRVEQHPDAVMPFTDVNDVEFDVDEEGIDELFEQDGVINYDTLSIYTNEQLYKMWEEAFKDIRKWGPVKFSSSLPIEEVMKGSAEYDPAKALIELINLVLEDRKKARWSQLDFAPNGAGLRAIARKMHGKGATDVFSKKGWTEYLTKIRKGRNDFPPKVRDILKKYGDKEISKAYTCRTPVPSLLTSALNVASFGEFQKRWDKLPYDKLFHLDLRLEINDGKKVVVILVEKNEVINMEVSPKKSKDSECQIIPNFKRPITLNQLLASAKAIQGDKFFNYSAVDNNCQDFIMALLKGNSSGTEDNFKFIKQKTDELFRGLPSLKRFANAVTDLGSTINTIVQGSGLDETAGGKIHKSENYYVQSVVFDKSMFDKKSAKEWIKKNNYEDKGVDETETAFRFRQVTPAYIEQKGFKKYRTKKIGRKSGISLILAYK